MRELSVILVNMIAAGTPILYALLGDMVSQRAGVISLSVEGSMVKYIEIATLLTCR